MYLGTFKPSLLEKGRIALPKKIRDNIAGSSVVLTIGFETCIFGFDAKTWEEVVQPELEKPLFSDEESRIMRRRMFTSAINLLIDRQGRVVIPDYMMLYAKIESELYVIGAGDHFEIWDDKVWKEYEQRILKRE